MEGKRKVAIFDVDGTIFRSSLTIRLVEQLIEDGAFPPETADVYEDQRRKWVDREGDYDAYVSGIMKAFLTHIKGLHYSVLADAAELLVERHWKETYRYTRDLVAEMRDKGYFLLALSHSPKTVLDKFCPRLGFDKAYGVILEIGPQELFTGNLVDDHLILNKANVLKRALEKENLSLVNSIGVGDTETDIPFLEQVAKPICFNPNMRLYRQAKRMKWKVIVERKDVIYDVTAGKLVS